jgi:hypothetical protein
MVVIALTNFNTQYGKQLLFVDASFQLRAASRVRAFQ